jgi:hypothetical protein
MELVESYAIYPGQCFNCGGPHLPAVDTGKDYEAGPLDGRVYICATCVAEWADALGWMSPSRHDYWKARVRASESKARKAREALDSLNAFFHDAFTEATSDLEEIEA